MIKIIFGGRGFNGRETQPLRLEAGEKILSAGCSARGNETSGMTVPAGTAAVLLRPGSAESLSKWALGPTSEIAERFVEGMVDWWDGHHWYRVSAYVPAGAA